MNTKIIYIDTYYIFMNNEIENIISKCTDIQNKDLSKLSLIQKLEYFNRIYHNGKKRFLIHIKYDY